MYIIHGFCKIPKLQLIIWNGFPSRKGQWCLKCVHAATLLHGHTFNNTDPLLRESTGNLVDFLRKRPLMWRFVGVFNVSMKKPFKQTVKLLVIWDAVMLSMFILVPCSYRFIYRYYVIKSKMNDSTRICTHDMNFKSILSNWIQQEVIS